MKAVDHHYRVVVWMGDTRGRYGPWEPGLPLAADRATILSVDAASPEEAAEAAFHVGNRQGADRDGKTWSPDIRSMSVGDLAFVIPIPNRDVDEVSLLAVKGSGWEPYLPSQFPPDKIHWGHDALVSLGAAWEEAAV